MLLGELPARISAATATVARSMPDFAARPIIRLVLGPDRRALISEVHDASDWVFTMWIGTWASSSSITAAGVTVPTISWTTRHRRRPSMDTASSSARDRSMNSEGDSRTRAARIRFRSRGAAGRGHPRSTALALGTLGAQAGLVADGQSRSPRAGAGEDVPGVSGRAAQPRSSCRSMRTWNCSTPPGPRRRPLATR